MEGIQSMNKGWKGMDLDGTLVKYTLGDAGKAKIGEIIPSMLARIKSWEKEGYIVKIFTARAKDSRQAEPIREFLKLHGLGHLDVTNEKDYEMVELWDDRAVQVVHNEGTTLEERIKKLEDEIVENGNYHFIDHNGHPDAECGWCGGEVKNGWICINLECTRGEIMNR